LNASCAECGAGIAESPTEGVVTRVIWGKPTEAYEAAIGSTLVRAFQRAILTRLETRPALIRKTGTGDMNTFAQTSSAQCVTYGPGDPKTSHSDEEFVKESDYLASIAVLKEAMKQLATLDPGGLN
jgi:LysW-gamma-L-lysine carboxypeptidase